MSRRSVWGIHYDTVNPRMFELQASKEILAEIYDIQISEVGDLIQQLIVDRQLFKGILTYDLIFEIKL